jgi:sugar phosphate isomerase/epimerase
LPSESPILSLQLYSLRQLGGLSEQLEAASSAGFKHVETIGSHLDDPQALKTGLSRHGLSAPTGHIGMAALRGDLQRIADACHLCGIGTLFMPAFPPEERGRTESGWRTAGEELGGIAEKMKSLGITLGYHNHNWELLPLEGGARGLDCLFDGAKGSPLVWQADVAWLARGGVDPADWLRKYAPILVSAHVKDQAPEGKKLDEDGWDDVGSGILPWPTLWDAAVDCGATVMVVEHDNPKDPAGFASRSFAYLRRFPQAA